MRQTLLAAACLTAGLICAGQANATVLIEMNLEGIGSNIQLDSFSFGVSGNYAHLGSGWQVQTPHATDITVTRTVDSSSTALLHATANGTPIPSGDIELFASSATQPFLDFHFSDAIVTSYQTGGHGSDQPEESVTFAFGQVTANYTPPGSRNPSSNPWGAVLPNSIDVQAQFGGTGACVRTPCPFLLDLNYDLATDPAQFGNSDIVMDATIPGQVPEPGSLTLLAAGLLGLGALCRRTAKRPLA